MTYAVCGRRRLSVPYYVPTGTILCAIVSRAAVFKSFVRCCYLELQPRSLRHTPSKSRQGQPALEPAHSVQRPLLHNSLANVLHYVSTHARRVRAGLRVHVCGARWHYRWGACAARWEVQSGGMMTCSYCQEHLRTCMVSYSLEAIEHILACPACPLMPFLLIGVASFDC